LLLLIDIITFLNYSLVETNGAIWCTFRGIKWLYTDLVEPHGSVHNRYRAALYGALAKKVLLTILVRG